MVFARLYNTCFLHTLERLVRGYKLSRFCTLPQKSQRFIAREQKLVYSSFMGNQDTHTDSKNNMNLIQVLQ
jgi:hypothetical protein